jgi:hypothetical protein
MGQLDKSALLQKEKLQVEKVKLGEDDFVYVTQMTGHGRDEFELSHLKKTEDKKGNTTYEQVMSDFRAKLAVATVCDEEGVLLFEPKDYILLSQNMSAAKLEKIVNVAQRLNAISEQDKEALVKNSKPDLEDNSSSGSVGK